MSAIAIGAGFSAIVKSGDQAPDLPGGVRLELDEHRENFQLGHLGGIALDASIAGPGINESNSFGIWAGRTADQLHLVFHYGQPIPDLPSQTLARVYSYSANGTGDVAMSIQRTDAAMEINEDDIWKYDADHGLQLAARQGEHAPGTPDGVTFDSFLGADRLPHLSINDFGQVAFIARLAGPGLEPSKNESLWVQNRNGQLQLVAARWRSHRR